jgi:hemerythrin-like domain-containing protein
MEDEIAGKMLKDHGRLISMLNKSIELLEKDFEGSKAEFLAFEEHLRRHLLVEDEAIFALFEKFSDRDTANVFDLIEQHVRIKEISNKIQESLKENAKPNLEELKKLIVEHSYFEVDKFYNYLDKNLGEVERREIALKIKNILIE